MPCTVEGLAVSGMDRRKLGMTWWELDDDLMVIRYGMWPAIGHPPVSLPRNWLLS